MATVEHPATRGVRIEGDSKKKRRQLLSITVGTLAMLAWLTLFGAGLLVESVTWRKFLAPHTFAKQEVLAKALNPPAASQPLANTPAPTKEVEYQGTATYAFVCSLICFTPTNLAFLAMLAGLIGGCASNLVAEQLEPEDRAKMNRERLLLLEEQPWAAAMRSFIVYLCVIAGLYLSVDDPFKDSTPAQYLRLAGLISALAFVVGYDPSRIQQWLRLLPSPSPVQVINAERAENVNVTQGTPTTGQATANGATTAPIKEPELAATNGAGQSSSVGSNPKKAK